MKEYYSILGVSTNATLEEITIAYKKRLKVVHPDRFDAKINPDEWQQANRMLQELNEAYAYLKKNQSNAGYTSSNQTSNNSSSSQEYSRSSEKTSSRQTNKTYLNEYTKARTYPTKGVTTCQINKLNLNHVQFINHLIVNKNEVVKINGSNLILNYAGFITAGYFYISNVQDWSKLSVVVEENYWLGVIFLFVLGALMARFGLVIFCYHTARLKPCIMFTPMYYIRVKYNQIAFAYAWEIESFNFHKKKYLSYFNIKIGNYFDKFNVPWAFSFDRFKSEIAKIDQLRRDIQDPVGWLTSNDILGGLKSEPIKKYSLTSTIGYLSSIVITVIVSIMLFNSLIIVDSSVPAKAKLENYASKEARKSASEDKPIDSVSTPPNILQLTPVKPFDKPTKPLPHSGKEYYYSGDEGIAPLQIVVPAHGDHYFVKVVDAYTNQDVKAVFVRSGDTVEIKVPLGSYKLKYATGGTWYGREYLFGPDTQVSLADSVFDFKWDNDQISGYTVELIKQRHGNLNTRHISLDEF